MALVRTLEMTGPCHNINNRRSTHKAAVFVLTGSAVSFRRSGALFQGHEMKKRVQDVQLRRFRGSGTAAATSASMEGPVE